MQKLRLGQLCILWDSNFFDCYTYTLYMYRFSDVDHELEEQVQYMWQWDPEIHYDCEIATAEHLQVHLNLHMTYHQ